MRANNSPSLLVFVLLPALLLSSSVSCVPLGSGGGEVSMGTTILAIRYDGGVVAGADTRTSSSGYVSNRYAAKLTFVLDGEADEFASRSTTLKKSSSSRGVVATVVSRRRATGGDDDDGRRRRRSRRGVGDDDGGGDLLLLLDDLLDDSSSARAERGVDDDRDASSSTCVICRSGSAADTQHLASIVRTELVSRRLLHRTRGTVTHAASLLRNLLSDDGGGGGGGGGDPDGRMSASLLCAGYDHELGRGVIYSIGTGGAMFEERDWAVAGSGSSYILGHLDSHYGATAYCGEGEEDGGEEEEGDDDEDRDRRRRLPSEEEAVEFVSNAIRLAMERDGSSGGFVRMYVIDKYGRRFVSRMMTNASDDGGGGAISRDGRAAVALRDFAPAAYPPASLPVT
jgi:20S proteasome subunit beta 1